MGKYLQEMSPALAAYFEKADRVLEYSLSSLCFEGPEEILKRTENTQPALYLVSAATLHALREAGITPDAVAGHSLGEYTALHAASVLDFESGLLTVRERGLAFAAAGAERPGAMAAIIGLPGAKVAEICASVSTDTEVAVTANYNEPSQTVISGDPAAVERAREACTAAGAKRALPLPVSGAFHSPLVASAAERLRAFFANVQFHTPRIKFVNNVSAEAIDDPEVIQMGLLDQVTFSVRWVECVQKLVELGAEAFVEVGSGKVLAGLAKRIAPEIPVYTTESADSLKKTIEALSSAN
jgi:[acyl-carrier-protein] S-malonyltransferase